MQYGSFRWWMRQGGGFAQALAEAFMRADPDNWERLAQVFPQMAEAHRLENWDKAPAGFDEYPNPSDSLISKGDQSNEAPI